VVEREATRKANAPQSQNLRLWEAYIEHNTMDGGKEMNEVYILTIIKELPEEHPEWQVSVFCNMESALRAYSISVDQARTEAEDYEFAHEDSELATDTYRYFRIYDLHGVETITIEVTSKEIIGEDSFDNSFDIYVAK
jgi:hypothetical protein